MKQKEITSTFVDEPTYLSTVKLRRYTWLPYFHKNVDLYIQPISVGKAELIGSVFLGMTGINDITDLSQSDQINKLLTDNIKPLVNAVGLAVCPGAKRPSEELLNAICNQISMTKLEGAITEVYRRLDLSPFFGILSLTKSLTANLILDQDPHGQE